MEKLNLNDCIKRVTNYLNSSDVYPRLVNFQNTDDLNTFIQHFKVGKNEFLEVSKYTKKDTYAHIERLKNALSSEYMGNVFLTGVSTQLKLQGEKVLAEEMYSYASSTFSCHLIIVCYQCEKYLNFKDTRANRLVYMVKGVCSEIPDIIFVAPQIPERPNVYYADGIDKIANLVEGSNGGKIFVRTDKDKGSFPNSLLHILEERDVYQVLCNIDGITRKLSPGYGTIEQWEYALHEVNEVGSWGKLIVQQFHSLENLWMAGANWKNFDEKRKWLLFIALKLYGADGNWCLSFSIQEADKPTELVRCVYRSILGIDCRNHDFWDKYDERKKLISSFGVSDKEVVDYLQMVQSKKASAIYYLTDLSKKEKEYMIDILAQYNDIFQRNEIMEILLHVYPDLYAYLDLYQFQNEYLTNYFHDYKYQKVINKIFPEFRMRVEEQAKRRDYNVWFASRSEMTENLNRENSRLYFVDAMGVEYLSYIMKKSKDNNLLADISLCICNLPSITEINKEFLELFDNIAPNIKQLDNIKHHGDESFDYRDKKRPFHIIRELEIVDSILEDIRDKLAMGSLDRAYIISDHGASRLAVINEHECKWEMASKGKHSGRCCMKDEADVQSEYVTESNGFWVLANYDRFKGGRKASVEVHGGATLEEIVTPIIEFTYVSDEPEISIHSSLPIKISYKKKAEIELFSKTKLKDVSVCVKNKEIRNFKNKYYDAVLGENNLFKVMMPDVKKAGTYTLDVYSNSNPIVSELTFSVVKESGTEKELL